MISPINSAAILLLGVALVACQRHDTVSIRIGGGNRSTYDLSSTNAGLYYRAAENWAQLDAASPEKISPSPEQWRTFWARLEEIGVWSWNSEYVVPEPQNVYDGAWWIVIVSHQGKRVEARGWNAYPDIDGMTPSPSFMALLLAVQNLIDGRTFQ